MSNNKQNSLNWLKSIVKDMIANGGDADLHAVLSHIERANAIYRQNMIDFLKWTEGTYSFGNVHGLWYEHINTDRQYTTEELYQKYNEEIFGGN